ncbi:MAG: DUF4351 domain-containing protein [Magnetococcales bacterium]|nr:DUF4351 domain-containing protein [Magnetococcales bacterium]
MADGLRDLDVDCILAEIKVTEHLTEKTLTWVSLYDTAFLDHSKLKRTQLQSVIISSITPSRNFLQRHDFKPVGAPGVYDSIPKWGGTIRIILLNELANESWNAPLKCFASRQKERNKAFQTIRHAGLYRFSIAFGRLILGLGRLLMRNSLNNPTIEGVTPEQIAILGGKEWLDFLVDTTPDEELFAMPRIEQLFMKRLQDERWLGQREGRQEGRQEGEISILIRQLQHRFGPVPEWATEKIKQANSSTLELWSLNYMDARTLEEVFRE